VKPTRQQAEKTNKLKNRMYDYQHPWGHMLSDIIYCASNQLMCAINELVRALIHLMRALNQSAHRLI
jgi:hypothetical protein